MLSLFFSVHCFNNYKGQQCKDLEISYLIRCKNHSVQKQYRQKNVQPKFKRTTEILTCEPSMANNVPIILFYFRAIR